MFRSDKIICQTEEHNKKHTQGAGLGLYTSACGELAAGCVLLGATFKRHHDAEIGGVTSEPRCIPTPRVTQEGAQREDTLSDPFLRGKALSAQNAST